MASHLYAEGETALIPRIGQFFMLAALLLGMFVAAPAMAQQPPAQPAQSEMDQVCGDHVGVTNRIAGCVRDTVANVADRFFDQDTGFYSLVSKFIAGFLTLGMAIYGTMAAVGMLEKVGRDTLIFLVKISFIAYFTLNADVMYRYAVDGMDAMGSAVVQVTPLSGDADGNEDFSDLTCYQAMKEASDTAGKPISGPWVAMDCLIDTVFGIRMPTQAGNVNNFVQAGGGQEWFNKNLEGQGMQRGMLHFFFSGMKTSVVGLMLGILGFIFMWGLITMIIKALMTYIAGYIGITFMMIISPLFMPLMLFRETKQYFDKWVKLVISFALQPVLILLFISLSIAGVDLALYSGDYSVAYRIAGDASRQQGFNLNRYLTDNEAINPAAMTPLFVKTSDTITEVRKGEDGVFPTQLSDCSREAMRSGTGDTEECAGNMPIQVFRDTIDWAKLAEIRTPAVTLEDGAERPEQQIAREVMAAVIFCGVVIFVMNRLMSVVPHILVDLVGDFGQTPNMFRAATGGWNDVGNRAAGQAAGAVENAIASISNPTRGGAG